MASQEVPHPSSRIKLAWHEYDLGVARYTDVTSDDVFFFLDPTFSKRHRGPAERLPVRFCGKSAIWLQEGETVFVTHILASRP